MEGKITFFASFYETLKKLPTTEERDRFAMGLLAYAFEGEEPDFEDSLALDLAFTNARPNLDASAKKARTARENGNAGGRPETKQETNAKTDRKTNAKTKQKTQPLLEKDMEKERDMEKEMEEEASFPLEEKKPSSDAADGAGCGRAAPPPCVSIDPSHDVSVAPHCPHCGRFLLLTQRGFECDEHEVIPIGEVDFR